MGESSDAPAEPMAGKGHNSKALSRDEKAALLTHHVAKLRAASAAVEEARGPFDEAKAELTALVNEAKADLGKTYTRKHLLNLVSDVQSRLRDLMREEEQRYQDRVALGLPVFGQQQELNFGGDETPQAAKDAIFWEAHGYLQGRRASDRNDPDGCPTQFEPDRLRGYDRGQDENGALFIRAQETIKRRSEPDADAEPEDLNAASQDEPDPLDPVEVDKAARNLKRKGFANRSAPEAEAPAAA